jgi:hypothetical protein
VVPSLHRVARELVQTFRWLRGESAIWFLVRNEQVGLR